MSTSDCSDQMFIQAQLRYKRFTAKYIKILKYLALIELGFPETKLSLALKMYKALIYSISLLFWILCGLNLTPI